MICERCGFSGACACQLNYLPFRMFPALVPNGRGCFSHPRHEARPPDSGCGAWRRTMCPEGSGKAGTRLTRWLYGWRGGSFCRLPGRSQGRFSGFLTAGQGDSPALTGSLPGVCDAPMTAMERDVQWTKIRTACSGYPFVAYCLLCPRRCSGRCQCPEGICLAAGIFGVFWFLFVGQAVIHVFEVIALR